MMKMLQVNLLVTSFCYLAFFNNLTQSLARTKDNKESLITNILQQQHQTHPLETRLSREKVTGEKVNYKKILKKGLSNHYDHHTIDQLYKGDALMPHSLDDMRGLSKNSHALNKKLLRKLGFMKVKSPNSHHRKRLAVESRRHTSPDDSHMFIIKLPPNFIYYTNPKSEGKSSSETKTMPQNGNVATFPFNSNGKPGRIYHWNLPVLQKILEKKKLALHGDTKGKKQVSNFNNIPQIQKSWENDIEKSYKSNYRKSLKHKSPSYYAPTAAVNRNSFKRYFPGNGKPKGFYLIKENQNKDIYYKDIVP